MIFRRLRHHGVNQHDTGWIWNENGVEQVGTVIGASVLP